MNLYVYYKADPANAQHIEHAGRGMQADLSLHSGLNCSLQRRPDTKDGVHTWMEVYHAVPQEFEHALALAVERAGLAQWIIGPRHAEYFVEIAACA